MSVTSLAQNGTPRLLYWLLAQRFTGWVRLSDLPGSPDATIHVHEGLPWFTDLMHSDSLLGELLLRARKINQEELHQTLMAMAQSGQLMGHILVAQGKLNAQELGQVLAMQCTQKLVHLFRYQEGTAKLEPQAKLEGLKAGLTQGVNPLNLIMQGIRHHWDKARILSVWDHEQRPSFQPLPVFAQYKSHFALTAQESEAASALTPGWTLDPQASTTQIQVAFALWNCAMLQSLARPKPKAPAARRPTGVPTARSSRPKTNVPIRPKGNRKTSARFGRVASGKSKETAANQSGKSSVDPKAREIFLANLETYESLIAREVHAFALFDLPLTATRSDVRKQWNQLSRAFHPDALPKLELENMHNRAQRVFAHLSNAYQILSNKERRQALKRQLESGIDPAQDTADVVRRTLESEAVIKDAERMVKKHQYARAKQLFEKANELLKDQADVLAGLAWCEYHIQERSPEAGKQAIAQLRKVAEQHQKCANASYYQGLIHVALQDTGAAARAFNAAIAINPRLLDAQRQLRALAARPAASAAKPKKKKLFGR